MIRLAMILGLLLVLAGVSPALAQEGFPGDKGRDEWRNDLVVYMWAVNQDAEYHESGRAGSSTSGLRSVPVAV